MSELPQGWCEVEFGGLNEFTSRTIDPSQFPDEVFELYSVPIFPTGQPELVKGSEIGSTKQLVAQNDVLVCKINPRINRVWIVGRNAGRRQIASSEWIVLRTSVHDQRYLMHYFRSAAFRELLCADVTGVGGSLTRAQPKRVASFPIPMAPLPEQKRIANKLDALLARVDAGRARLDRIPTLLKRFRQSVLAAATSGQLTEDWRGEQNDEGSWMYQEPKSLGEVAALDVGYAFKSAEYKPNGVRLLRGDNIEPGRLRWRDAKHYSENKLEGLKHLLLSVGDVVLAMDRPIISSGLKIARVCPADIPAVLVQRVCRFKPGVQLRSDYLFLLLQSKDFISHLKGHQNGSGVPHISAAQILSFKVRLPPPMEQVEIVRRVDSLFAFASQIEAKNEAAISRVEHIVPALLDKAFRGELVSQDHNDEPADQLIARIRASVPEEARPKKSSKKTESA